MGRSTAIEWTDATFNPWIGCTNVSPGCDNCYAEELATRRMGVVWGPHGERRRTGDKNWNEPRRWNRRPELVIGAERAAAGDRPFVFTASLADIADNQVSIDWFRDLVDLAAGTPRLVHLWLTKRPQNIAKRLAEAGRDLPPNVALGTSIVIPDEVDRNCSALLGVPGALFYFVSAEPLLGDIAYALFPWLGAARSGTYGGFGTRRISWVIAGGESGLRARIMHPQWARNLRFACDANIGVTFNFKQWGEFAPAAAGWTGHPNGIIEDGTFYPSRLVRLLTDDPDGPFVIRKGKKAAGHLLDGVAHLDRPWVPLWTGAA